MNFPTPVSLSVLICQVKMITVFNSSGCAVSQDDRGEKRQKALRTQ